MTDLADLGVLGLATMGANLARNAKAVIMPSTPLPAEPEEMPGNLLTPEYAVQPPENQME